MTITSASLFELAQFAEAAYARNNRGQTTILQARGRWDCDSGGEK